MSILQEANGSFPGRKKADRDMPDIAETRPEIGGRLNQVGMSHIEMPIRLLSPSGAIHQSMAVVDAYVSLDDPQAKGIHMSRLFLALQTHMEENVFAPEGLHSLLETFVEKHEGISNSASIVVRFDWMRKRRALVSTQMGWRSYPVVVRADLNDSGFRLIIDTEVTYSSTCPCSAALARQLIQERFERDVENGLPVTRDSVLHWLGEPESICATPHSQRSTAHISVTLRPDVEVLDIDTIINEAEEALQTPVQAAVKREDEQAFALRNGQNLMFCEDAARRLKHTFESFEELADFEIRVTHKESLHPHNAEAIVRRGY